ILKLLHCEELAGLEMLGEELEGREMLVVPWHSNTPPALVTPSQSALSPHPRKQYWGEFLLERPDQRIPPWSRRHLPPIPCGQRHNHLVVWMDFRPPSHLSGTHPGGRAMLCRL